MLRPSIVIPVWNDRAGLERLLKQIIDYDISDEIIICDDASSDDYSPSSFGITSESTTAQVKYIRSDRQRGAGAMRNIGLAAATKPHVIFFDSDDLFAPGIRDILLQLDDRYFDFCIFRHQDNRVASGKGSFPGEEERWTRIGATPQVERLNSSQCADLVQISAYPWNKIYRREFLVKENIKCTEILVHNDLELHWSCFIAASTILSTTVVGAQHFWHESGRRLTNRKDDERLKLITALENVAARLRVTPGRSLYVEPFTSFSFRAIHWAGSIMDPSHQDTLHHLSRLFFLRTIRRDFMTIASYENPTIAKKIFQLVAGWQA